MAIVNDILSVPCYYIFRKCAIFPTVMYGTKQEAHLTEIKNAGKCLKALHRFTSYVSYLQYFTAVDTPWQ